ncbi:serine/threonine-protein kinase [Streptomyces sp. HB132]|uniref:serine/threonine-protein kinase n=1 Tax=Streptomyces sp. HB132 TaxID=767388 RepID=UPI0019606B05|nr:serine/threonine-protein kinase [Streptomyces sp. HB132]MBM7442110.1 serine/threonine protein kinase [Streptomyces sp. HB132]
MRLRDFAQTTASRCSAEVLSGRYRLDGLLGSGGAADVYRGFDLRLRRQVAVKIFRPDACTGGEETLVGEGLILARLHHPGLVAAFDAGQHDGRTFLVMQLVQGTTLKERIAAGPLPPDATAALGAGLAQALGHAHDAGIVHRDVKPSNILLDDADRPYLADFGISRRLDTTTRTATGTLMGTPAYLSPEQVLGRPVGRPADIYALGLVLLECLTGRLEYDGGPLEAAIARLHRRPDLPHELPEQLSRLLRNMTALDEQDRPPARDCAHALTAVADTAPMSLAPSTPATTLVAAQQPSPTAGHTHANPITAMPDTRPRPPARRRLLVVGTAAALTVAVATAVAVTGTGSSAPQDNGTVTTGVTGTPSDAMNTPGNTAQKTAPATTAPAAPSSGHSTSVDTRPGGVPRQGLPVTSRSSNDAPADSADAHGSAGRAASPRDKDTSGAPPGKGHAPQPSFQPPGQAKKKDAAGRKGPEEAESATGDADAHATPTQGEPRDEPSEG